MCIRDRDRSGENVDFNRDDEVVEDTLAADEDYSVVEGEDLEDNLDNDVFVITDDEMDD